MTSKLESQETASTQSRPYIDTQDLEHDFAKHVLDISDNETEGEYEEGLLTKARQYGVFFSADQTASPIIEPAHAHPTAHARTHSTDSGISASSSVTFDLSKGSNKFSTQRRGSGTSTINDHDSILSNVRRTRGGSHYTSQTTTPSDSTRSLLSKRSSTIRPSLVRGLSRLRLRRTDSDSSVQRFVRPHRPKCNL